MSIDRIENDLRLALAERAACVPDDSADRLRRLHYPIPAAPRRPVLAISAGAAAVAAGIAVYTAGAATHSTTPARPIQLRTTPLAYVGTDPRLAVTRLPAGFKVGPTIPWPTLPGKPAPRGALPGRSFVSASGDSILLAEGMDGDGPVAKLLAFASGHPDVTTLMTVAGTRVTVVDLAAADVGAGYVLYWPVNASSWALLSGSAGVSLDQLMTVAAGIITAGD